MNQNLTINQHLNIYIRVCDKNDQVFVFNHFMSSINCQAFIVKYSSSSIHYQVFIIKYSSSSIHFQVFIIKYSSSSIHCQVFMSRIHCQVFIVKYRAAGMLEQLSCILTHERTLLHLCLMWKTVYRLSISTIKCSTNLDRQYRREKYYISIILQYNLSTTIK